jgi:hypothetical protein
MDQSEAQYSDQFLQKFYENEDDMPLTLLALTRIREQEDKKVEMPLRLLLYNLNHSQYDI